MNGKRLYYKIEINPRYATIYRHSKYICSYTGYVQGRDNSGEKRLWSKLQFIYFVVK